MNDLLQLLNRLEQRKIQLWSENGRLRFRAPEGALSEEIRAEVRARKDDILSFLENPQAIPQEDTAPPLQPAPRDAERPLSFAQERLWFLDQFEDGVAAQYNEPSVTDFLGPLRPHALAQAFSTVVARHEALRSRFPSRQGAPSLVVEKAHLIALPEVDLTSLPAPRRQGESNRLSGEEAQRPFNLSNGPLLRLTLLRLDAEHHRLLLTLHHITSDAWSSAVLFREVAELYGAFLEGRPHSLPPLPVQYPDFALWQRQFLRGEVLQRQIDWWREQLAGLPQAPLELPIDRPRPPRPGNTAGVEFWAPGEASSHALEKLVQESGASSFMVLLAAFGTLLGRYSGRLNPTVGSPIANRGRAELEGLIGFFVNTLVLPIDLSANPKFEELLRRTRSTTLDAFEHQDIPFEKLVEVLGVERNPSFSPLFQAILSFDNTPRQPKLLQGLRIAPAPILTALAKFDLTFLVSNDGDRLGGRLEYRLDLFDRATIERLLGHLEVLLGAAAENPQCPVADLPLLSAGEHHQLLVAWNHQTTTYDRRASLHRLVAQQGEMNLDAVVLVGHRNEHHSWSRLLDDAQRLSASLRQHGVRPGTRVAVCLERRPRRITSLLAILQTGAAYVPLAVGDPPQRLASILADATPVAILSEVRLAPRLPSSQAPLLLFEDLKPRDLEARPETRARGGSLGQNVHCLSEGRRAGGSEFGGLVRESHRGHGFPDEPLGSEPIQDVPAIEPFVGGNWPAYVTYTSGSTGKPKGVIVPHRAVVRLVQGARWLDLSSRETLFHLSPLAFDASTFEIWGALLRGGRLVLMEPGMHALEDLGAAIRRQRISTLWLTTGLFHAMVEEGLENLHNVGQIITGGEVISVPHVERARKALQGRLLNAYGPTENTTFSTIYPVPGDLPFTSSVPIGKPIDGSQAHVLDRRLRPVPVGVAGELWVGGDGLAQSYVNRPALTAERFVPDPFRATEGLPGARLYGTGDRVRRLPSGDIEFLGRFDQQVKLRGFRIEPGEIETALTEQEGVREALVLMVRDGNGEAHLVAYLTTETPVPEERHLRHAVSERLPAYMVPSAWVFLDKFPRTANNKVDRNRLPTPNQSAEESSVEPPQSPAEEILASLFSELLGRPIVDRQANFFDLGGQSLLAIRLVSRLRTFFERQVPVRTVFESPTVSALASLLTAEESGQNLSLNSASILPTPEGEEPSLSFAQERLWFLDLLDDGAGSTYNVPAALSLTGPLNDRALATALAEVESRHLTLRSRFQRVEGQPRLEFAPPRPPALPLIDLSALPATAWAAEEERQLKLHSLRPFTVSREPLVRSLLFRRSGTGEDHVLLLVFHHIVCDAASLEIFSQELAALYNGYQRGKGNRNLVDLPIQFHDFARWQRQQFAEADGPAQQALQAWLRRLENVPPLHLPTDRPRPAFQSTRGALLPFTFSHPLQEDLRHLGQSHGTTFFMTLLAAWGAVLARTSGQFDFAIGTPVTQRRHRETESLIGFFVETAALRLDFSNQPTALDLLSLARRRSFEAYDLGDVPFEKLVAELEPQRDPGRSPLFQVMLSWRGVTSPLPQLSGVEMEVLDLPGTIAKFDLTLVMGEAPEGLNGWLEYNRDLFDLSTVEHHLNHLRYFLEGLAATPETPCEDLPLFGASERAQLTRWEVGPRHELPSPALLHRLFEEQVQRTPTVPAVEFNDQVLTYSELDRRANHLAAHLQHQHSVGPEVVVAFLAERSLEMVIGLLGILKAGGVYLPLDPDTPQQRLAFLLQDAGVSLILLTSEGLTSKLPVEAPYPAVHLAGTGAITGTSPHRVESTVRSANLAYVLYTSGSTGQPKAVAIPHASIVNHMQWQQRVIPADVKSRVLQKTPLVFDVSLCEIFGPLMAGGCLVVAPSGEEKDIQGLIERMHATEVNTLHLPPSLLQALLQADAFSSLRMRHITCGGEAVPTAVATHFVEKTGITLHNCYGPTESAIDATSHPFRPSPTGQADSTFVLLGRPLDNLLARVQDRRGRPLPVGIPGELVLCGSSLARGYLARPARTAESFVPATRDDGEPAIAAGERFYRTGDLVRRLADGNLEFLGRIDHQVKIRGVRIELGEVEAALRSHPQVVDAVAAVRQVAGGSQLLAAYAPRTPLTAQDLRSYLTGHLPESVLPSLLFPLDPLPRTVNGKMDRPAVVAAAAAHLDAPHASALPTTPTEQALAEIFSDLLHLAPQARERLGVDSHFFELGGHSLLATRLVSRLRRYSGVELPLRTVFESPRLSELARQLDAERGQGDRPSLPPITQVSQAEELLPLSFAQQRLWFLAQLEGASASYNMPCALRLEGRLHRQALEKSLLHILQRHDALRTRFPAENGEPHQVVEPPPKSILTTVDLTALDASRRALESDHLLGRQARRPFDLTEGPLVRALLLRLEETQHQFLIDLHHIVSDGWSMGVLVRELSVLYNAFCTDHPSPLSPLPVQYSDFALWQRRVLSGTTFAHQLEYWRETLAGAPSRLDLPTDRPRPPVMGHRGAYGKVLPIEASTIPGLSDLEQQAGATRFMSLFTACVLLLSRAGGQRDVVIGTPIANRNRVEVEPLIGFFANTLALRVDLKGQPTGLQLLERVKAACLSGYDHQDLPFEHLVEALQPERDLSHTPLFQHLFLFDEAATAETLQLPGLALTPLTIPTHTAKFDLLLSLHPAGEDLMVGLEYNSDLFDASTVERLTRTYRRLLQGLIAQPDQPVDEIPWLEAAEHHQLLNEWSVSEAPTAPSVVQGVAERALLSPDAVALEVGERALSYGTLVQRARILANTLAHRGFAADRPVALVAHRRTETLVALLALIEGGACCLAIDPSWPSQRLRFILRDAGVQQVLGNASDLNELPLEGLDSIALDRVLNDTFAHSVDRTSPSHNVSPQQLAYLVYTSGSTGQPKGVAMSHHALSTVVAWQNQCDAQAAERTAQFSSLGFDVSFQEIFSTWTAGGTLVVVEDSLRRDPPAFLRWLGRHAIRRQFLPFVALQQLAEAVEAGHPFPQSLQRVITAGEQLQATDALTSFFSRDGAPILVNQYGPSETHVASGHVLNSQPAGWPALPPIGRPGAGRQVLVCERHQTLAPVGVVGEIYLGGEGLARGYVHRPAWTAERFVPHPFASRGGQRLYRSGDLGRWLPSGELEFLGRSDQQVKIRGFRVEPGEIEVALSQHGEVAECAVVPCEDLHGILQLVACYRSVSGAEIDDQALRTHLQDLLPAPLVPARFLAFQELPWTATGKVDRLTLTRQVAEDRSQPQTPPSVQGSPTQQPPMPAPAPQDDTRSQITNRLSEIWCRLLGLERVRGDANFFELGGHSLLIVKVQSEIRKHLDLEVPVVDLFRFPTLNTLTQHLLPEPPPGETTAPLPAPVAGGGEEPEGTMPVAIIGMAGRFPGAEDVEAFWRNIRDGVESIRFFSDAELEKSGIDPALLEHPNYVKAKGILDDIEGFDAHFFNISPSEAEVMDPQQRLFLESAWQALESTGYLSASRSDRVGVFAGSGFNSYFMHNLYPSRHRLGETNPLQLLIGAEKDFLPTTVSYRLNLTGPSINVQTACSTSLVAVHLACRALAHGDCELALAGGVGVHVPAVQGYVYEKGMIYSPDGHCRPFSGEADGTVGGDGVAAVVLKPLHRAQADGDTIYAVIRGSALNNDGDLKVGFTAPGVDGQAAVIRDALKAADVPPETIGYLEAHGSGTELGDPVEVSALVNAFDTESRGTCALGAVKANVGHLDAAAGVASLLKATLALYHGELPAGLHGEKPHPQIDLETTPFYLNRQRRPWPEGATPRRAGVSSFGIGGTNAHVILEEPPAAVSPPASQAPGPFPLLLSARSPNALKRRATDLRAWLESHPEAPLPQVAYTLAVGRRDFEYRWGAVCSEYTKTLEALEKAAGQEPFTTAETLEDERGLLTAIQRWIDEQAVDWQAFFPAQESRRFLPLPTYPFERRRHWVDPPSPSSPPAAQPEAAEQTQGAPTAQEAPSLAESRWWILEMGTELGSALADRLRLGGANVVRVTPAAAFRELGTERYEVALQKSDFQRLLEVCQRPHHVLHLWSLPRSATSSALPGLGFEGIQALLEALTSDPAVVPAGPQDSVHLTAVLPPTNGDLHRDKATLLGALTWFGGRREELQCHFLEIEPPQEERPEATWLDRLLHLLAGGKEESSSSSAPISAPESNGREPSTAKSGQATKKKRRTVHPRPNLPVPFVAPESAEELALAELWSDLLRVEPIGVHDSFFELGGHSLVATQMLIRLRERYDVSFDLGLLFENPTISKLSELIQNELWTRASLEEARLAAESPLTTVGLDEEEGEL